jgi:cytochrome c oxidase subunit 4
MTARLVVVWISLLAALGATVALAHFFPGYAWLTLIGAAAQVALLLGGFVRLQDHQALVRFFALGAGFWIVLMFTLTLADLVTR